MTQNKKICYRCGKEISNAHSIRHVGKSATPVFMHKSCAKAGDKQLTEWKKKNKK